MRVPIIAAALSGALLAQPAVAHVTLDPPQAAAGSTVRLTLRVPHGCAGAATEGLTLRLPDGVTAARPMPKPGWQLAVTRRVLEAPVSNGHGGTITEAPAEITWAAGSLPDDQFDEFVLMLRAPEQPGETLWLPVVQHCAGGATANWTEVPTAGRRVTDYRFPAPSLRLLPARARTEGN